MNKLPRISGSELIKYLTEKGYVPTRHRGSHIIMKLEHDSTKKITTIPLHSQLDTGTLLAILEQVDIDRDTFIEEWYNR